MEISRKKISLVKIAIGKDKLPMTCFFTINELSFINWAIRQSMDAFTVRFVVMPFPLVFRAIRQPNYSSSWNFTFIIDFSLIIQFFGNTHPYFRLHLISAIWSLNHSFIRPDIFGITIPKVILHLSFKYYPVVEFDNFNGSFLTIVLFLVCWFAAFLI